MLIVIKWIFVIIPWAGIFALWLRIKRLQRLITEIISTITINAQIDLKILENEERIDNIVDMLRRNARIAALNNETGVMNSPLRPTTKSKPYYDAIKNELMEYYLTIGVNLTDRELFEDVQRRLGPLIEEKICNPMHMTSNECIEIAIGYMIEQEQAMKQTETEENRES